MIDGAEHAAHLGDLQLTIPEGDGLIGEAQTVTHGTIGSTAEQPQRLLIEGHLLFGQYVAQMLDDLFRQHVLQRELQTAGQDGDRQFLWIGGGQQELDVGRRLFQGLQQGVETVAGEHVHFVDEVDLEAPAGGCVLHVIQQLAGVLDLGPTGRIDLDQVDETSLVDFPTGRTHTAGLRADTRFAVQTFGQNPRNGGLADPAGAGEQISVVQAIVIQRIDQCLQHVGLTDHFTEQARTPFAG